MAAQRRKDKRQLPPHQAKPQREDHSPVKAAWINGAAAVTAAVAAAVIGGVFLLMTDDENDEPSPANESVSPPAPQPDVLVGSDACSEPFGASDLAAGEVIIDGRCDPDPNAPVGTYREPRQDGDLLVERLNNGGVRIGECLVEGESIANDAGAASNQWVRYKTDDGPAYIPTIWTHGEETLDTCRA